MERICKWYLNLEGACFTNGSLCCNPFSEEGCKIQNRDIFHKDNIPERYESSEKDKKLTKSEVWRILGIEKKDIIGDYIIPYRDISMYNVDLGVIISEAISQVEKKFKKENIKIDMVRVFHNVEVLKDEYGVYIIGVKKHL